MNTCNAMENGDNYQTATDNYMTYDAIDVMCNEQSEDDSDTDASIQSFDVYSKEAIEDYQFLQKANTNYPRNAYHRRNFNCPTRCSLHTFSRQNKSIKRFAFFLGFATLLIFITQIYSTVNYEYSLEGWEKDRSRYLPLYIHPRVNTTLIEPSDVCKENTPVLLLIVIFSAPNNFEERQTLRETWANTTEFNYSKFVTIHSQYKGKYLPINYPDWRNFIVKQDENVPTESSRNASNTIRFIDDSSHENFRIRTVFLIGQTENNDTQDKIVDESRTHNDLIQESFLDSYNNLTLKSVMMVKWINNNCAGKVKFFMKCDDDTFVNVPNLIHFLMGGTIPVYKAALRFYNDKTIRTLNTKNRLNQYKNLLIGFRFSNAKPILNYRSKWFIPRYMYDKETFPNYLSGSGYVFTIDTAIKLYNASLEMPLLHLEDVYLTGICAKRAQIQPINFHLFHYLSYQTLCECRGMITKHEVKIDDMRRAYDFVVSSKNTCQPPKNKSLSLI